MGGVCSSAPVAMTAGRPFPQSASRLSRSRRVSGPRPFSVGEDQTVAGIGFLQEGFGELSLEGGHGPLLFGAGVFGMAAAEDKKR